jgi:GNAT superfamily N-acetyltransferase
MSQPTFRRVTLADRPAMLDICATVWEGEDYLPRYFDRWVAAADTAGGQFTALELEGQVVALAKFTRMAPGEYWLEGIRVHADHRGQGLAAAMHDYHLALWKETGEAGALRLLTGDPAIIKLCERTGFRPLFHHRFAEAPAAEAPHAFLPVTPTEAQRAWAGLAHSAAWAEWHGLCDLGWKWRELTPEFFGERVAAGAVYQWRNWEAVLMTRDTQHDDDQPGDFVLMQFPAVSAAYRWEFLAEARGLAHLLRKRKVLWSVPLNLSAALPQAGYTLAWAETETCFEACQ